MRFIIVIALLWIIGEATFAQTDRTIVPDLTALSVPQAAEQLSLNGLRLGDEIVEVSQESSPDDPRINSILAQNPAAGESQLIGAAVTVTVLRPPTVKLIYDDNDLTLQPLTASLPLNGLRFVTVSGSSASFPASEWGDSLTDGRCAQVWSVARTSAKSVEGCPAITAWLSTTDPDRHFWTTASGAERFALEKSGVAVGECPAADPTTSTAPLSCYLAVPDDTPYDTAAYFYAAYTPDTLIVRNADERLWMRLDAMTVGALDLSDTSLYELVQPLADPARLAPDQCVVLTVAIGLDIPLPEPCQIIAQVQLSEAFWLEGFNVTGTSGESRRCAAPAGDALAVCVLPRA